MYLFLFGLFCTPISSMKTHIKNTPKPKNQQSNSWIFSTSTTEPTNLFRLTNGSLERYQEHQLPDLLNDYQLSFTSKKNDFWAVTEISWATNYVHVFLDLELTWSPVQQAVMLFFTIRNRSCFRHVRETKHWCKCASKWELKTLIEKSQTELSS